MVSQLIEKGKVVRPSLDAQVRVTGKGTRQLGLSREGNSGGKGNMNEKAVQLGREILDGIKAGRDCNFSGPCEEY